MSKNLQPGTTIPDLELPDEEGELHRLSELQGDNVLVLHLSRGEHCPRERQHHRELLHFHELCSVAFTELVTIMPNVLHDVFKLKISTGARWTFLSDADLEVQKHFDINEYTDTHHDNAGVPHTLILSPGLVIEKVYVGYWFWGRPVERPALGRHRRAARADEEGLRPDDVFGPRGVGGVAVDGRCGCLTARSWVVARPVTDPLPEANGTVGMPPVGDRHQPRVSVGCVSAWVATGAGLASGRGGSRHVELRVGRSLIRSPVRPSRNNIAAGREAPHSLRATSGRI